MKQKTAVGYIRVSSKEQQQTGFSLEAQIKILNDYGRKKGIKIIHIYMDVESAKQKGRKEFGHLVKFLRSQKALPPDKRCNTVIVEKTDRFYRNIEDLAIIRDVGVEAHLIKEGSIISSTSGSNALFNHGLDVLVAERFCRNLSEEVIKGMTEKACQGLWPSQAPLGYLNVTGKNDKQIITQDLERAPLVRLLFEEYATGIYSTKDIAKKARSIGLTHRKSGYTPNKSCIYDMLNNPIYYGAFYWKGILYQGSHEPIISKTLFEQVQSILHKKSSCPTGRQKHDFLFHAMITCAYCDCAMVAEIKKGKYVYYHCTGNKGKCPGKYAREEIIDQQFADALANIQLDDDVIRWIASVMDDSNREKRITQEAQQKALSNQISKLESRLDNLYIDKLDDKLSDDQYDRMYKKFSTELEMVQSNLAACEDPAQTAIPDQHRIQKLLEQSAALYAPQPMTEKRKLLNMVFTNSTWASGKLSAGLRKPFQLLAA